MNRQIYDNYVIQVVQSGSLTAAAKELYISQPALSQGLSSLEKEIGYKIFNRRTNPITLTPEGEIYFRYLQRADVVKDNYNRELLQYQQGKNQKVTIGAPTTYVQSVIVPGIEAMGYTECRISIKTGSVERLLEMSEAGKIDCFICTLNQLPENYRSILLYREDVVLCVPEDSSIGSLEDPELLNQRFICLGDEFPLQQEIRAFLQENGIRPKRRIIMDQIPEAVRMVERGLGVCFASKEAASGCRVKTIPTEITGRNIYLAYDQELFHTDACNKLIEAILQSQKERQKGEKQ